MNILLKPREVTLCDDALPIRVNGEVSQLDGMRVQATITRPVLALSVASVDFGVALTRAKEPLTRVVTLSSLAPAPFTCFVRLRRSVASAQSPFALALGGGPVAKEAELFVAPGAKIDLTFHFAPEAEGSHDAVFDVVLADEAKSYATVHVSGKSEPPSIRLSDDIIALPPVPPGKIAGQIFFIFPESATQTKDDFEVTLQAQSRLRIVTPSPGVVPAGQALPLLVLFTSDSPRLVREQVTVRCGALRTLLTVAGVCEASLLTTYPYFREHPADYDGKGSDFRLTKDMERWFSLFGMPSPLPLLVPGSLVTELSRTALDVIEYLANEKIGGIPLLRPRVLKPGQIVGILGKLLDFLRARGAVLDGVRPEVLSTRDEFVLSTSQQSSNERDLRCLRDAILAQCFDQHSGEVWLRVLTQVLRLFVLPRVAISRLPESTRKGVSEILAKISASDTLHGQQERIVLAWLTFHSERVHGRRSCPVRNFTTDLADGRVLAALFLSHAPILSREVLEKFYAEPSNMNEQRHNALRIMSTLKALGLHFNLSVDDFLCPSPVYMLLLCVYLFENLGDYLQVPKSVSFSTVLLRPATKQINISNPGKIPLLYHAHLHGSVQFHVASTFLVRGGGTASIPVSFDATRSTPESAILYLVGEAQGRTERTVLVFSLEAQVTVSAEVTASSFSTPCYTKCAVPILVQNPFGSAGTFAVKIVEEVGAPKPKGKRAQGKAALPEQAFVEELAALFPPAAAGGTGAGAGSAVGAATRPSLWCSEESVEIPARGSSAITVHFLPTRLGFHSATLLLKDARVGEFVLPITAFSTLPSPAETLKIGCRALENVEQTFELQSANKQKEGALLAIANSIGPEAIFGSGPEAGGASSPATYAVRYTGSEFLAGPSVVLREAPGQGRFFRTSVDPPARRDSRGGGAQILFPVQFQARDPGLHVNHAILVGADDVRVLRFEAIVDKAVEETLEMHSVVLSSAAGVLWIENTSPLPWHLRTSLSGDKDAFDCPAELTVPARGRACLSVGFRPAWLGTYSALALLEDDECHVAYRVGLVGHAQYPTGGSVTSAECHAGEAATVVLRVENGHPVDVEFEVESDVEWAQFPATLAAAGGAPADLSVVLSPKLSGAYSGHVWLLSKATGQVHTFVVQVQVSGAKEEGEIALSCPVGEGREVELELANPLSEAVVFGVRIDGDAAFLSAPPSVSLGPTETRKVQIQYRPTAKGRFEATLVIDSPKVGETVYRLHMDCTRAPPIQLEKLVCPLGQSCSRSVTIQNPLQSAVVLEASSSAREFEVFPAALELGAGASGEAEIVYTPSRLQISSTTRGAVPQRALITLQHPDVGIWEYDVVGEGTAPRALDAVWVRADRAVGSGGENEEEVPFEVPFRNVFAGPVSLQAEIYGPDVDSFRILWKNPKRCVVCVCVLLLLLLLFSQSLHNGTSPMQGPPSVKRRGVVHPARLFADRGKARVEGDTRHQNPRDRHYRGLCSVTAARRVVFCFLTISHAHAFGCQACQFEAPLHGVLE
jgi:hypothetical protein